MRRSRRGKRGGDVERFAYIPESLLESIAGQTLPHAALKILTILVLGRTKERNGTMCCSESHAKKFGITSRATVHRSLEELQARGIITVTRKVKAFQKWPTLYSVTWWPVYNRDGQPLDRPEDATYAYLKWTATTPTIGVDEKGDSGKFAHTHHETPSTPAIGVESTVHHTHSDTKPPFHHTHHEGKSLYLGAGRTFPHSVPAPTPSSDPAPYLTAADRIRKLRAQLPHLTDSDVAKICKVDLTEVQRAREGAE